MKKFLFFSVLVIFMVPALGQSLPSGFGYSNATIGATWSEPVGATFTSDGLKLFVWEKRGRVYVCNRSGSNYSKQTTPVIDISAEVLNDRDFGLVGFALDPNFQANGYIYLLYVVDRRFLMNNGSTPDEINEATIGRVTRYQTTTSQAGVITADMGSRTILIGETPQTGLPILHQSHGVGTLAFAADGTLLVTHGDGACYNHTDGGSDNNTTGGITFFAQALNDGIIRPEENVGAFRSQLLNSHSGKLLRINPENGDGMSSNPFYDASAPRSPKSRVWALGLRNPFRMTVKPGSGSTNPSAGDIGEIFIGDVGWSAWEEMNVAKVPGSNFGWPIYEGHEIMSSYNNLSTLNMDEPNPFGTCSGNTHLRFKDLIRQDNAAKNKSIFNPCNPNQLIGTSNRFIHARPMIDWRHGQNTARVGKFDSNGNATAPTIGTAASETIGTPFRGNCTSGGIWYTGAGNTFPPEYKNTLIMADYNDKWIRRLTIDYTDVVSRVDVLGTGMGAVVCLAENPIDGSIICVDIAGNMVRKITYGGNIPPVPKIKADNYYSPDNTLLVNFDGTESSDQDGNIVSYSWNFGDPGSPSNTSNSPTPNHQFTSNTGPKKYTVTLTVTDNGGSSSTEEFIVSVSNTPPEVFIVSPEKNSKYKLGPDTTYMRIATVNDQEHSGSQLTYEWQTTLVHNEHVHPEAIKNDVQSPSPISRMGCNGDDYSWLVTLKVTDAAGLSTIDSSQIFPDCVGTLPIYLHKFSVTQAGAVNLVKWTTEMESDMEHFILERSADGRNFFPINRQPASNTVGPNHYSYADNSFMPGVNFYRLKMVELGEVVTYSIIIKTVTEGEKNVLRMAPNPVIDKFSLQYFSPQDDVITIEIKDVAGRVMKTARESVNKGQNLVYLHASPTWPSGMYLLTVQDRSGTQQVKFVKAK